MTKRHVSLPPAAAAGVDEFITESTGRGPSKLYGTRFRCSTNHRDGYGIAVSRASVI